MRSYPQYGVRKPAKVDATPDESEAESSRLRWPESCCARNVRCVWLGKVCVCVRLTVDVAVGGERFGGIVMMMVMTTAHVCFVDGQTQQRHQKERKCEWGASFDDDSVR